MNKMSGFFKERTKVKMEKETPNYSAQGYIQVYKVISNYQQSHQHIFGAMCDP